MMSDSYEKEKIRKAMLTRRRALATAWVREMSERIMTRLLAMEEFNRAVCVGSFLSQPKEVHTKAMILRCWDLGHRVCVPAFDLESGVYRMALLERGAEMAPGPAGILEPRVIVWVDPEEIDFIAVPAVAFDRQGVRLGHGGGYYDRLLARSPAFKVGIVFDFQVIEKLPQGNHDQRVHCVLTECREYICMEP